ncbi:MAG TPA: 3-phosphoshikimate 1-carboxyvinyltransferase, partial [Pyrinomonadaceae bacterium]|nr:3-phosphoshikimate 1-carboxyvinyltransferase [Pyrinomonadaceae bacterium]
MRIRPARRLRGRVRVPGDKSVSHRAAIIAALARGRTEITNFSTSADCASTLECLRQLGIIIERDGTTVRIEGVGTNDGQRRFHPPSAALDCGNSGTTMRLLAGVLASQGFASTLKGDDYLSRRPMRRVIEPLGRMGARLTSDDGCAPLVVEGRSPLVAIEYEPTVASAQVKSCVLLAGLGAEGRTRVVERGARTRDHTERMLAWLGAEIEMSAATSEGTEIYTATVGGPARLEARDLAIPGDISSAAFLLIAAAMLPGSDLTIEGVGLNPTRAEIISTLRDMGADVRVEGERESCNELIGDVSVRGGAGTSGAGASIAREGSNVIAGARVARLIDELPALAVFGTQAPGGLEIRGARELRVKESDRIGATVANLRAMGAEVEEYDDGLRVVGPVRLRGARLESFGDHRIAMAFAVAALTAEGES